MSYSRFLLVVTSLASCTLAFSQARLRTYIVPGQEVIMAGMADDGNTVLLSANGVGEVWNQDVRLHRAQGSSTWLQELKLSRNGRYAAIDTGVNIERWNLGVIDNIPDTVDSIALAVSSSGNLNTVNDVTGATFMWSQGSGFQSWGPNDSGVITSVSRSGLFRVGTSYLPVNSVGFLASIYAPDGSHEYLPARNSNIAAGYGHGVSEDGQVVVGQDSRRDDIGGTRNDIATIWRRSGQSWNQLDLGVGLGHSSWLGFGTMAIDITADGSIVVGSGYGDMGPGGEAFIWDAAHGRRSLYNVLSTEYGLASQLDGWELNFVRAISADGRYIAGSGNFNGNIASWVVDTAPVPEPASMIVLLGGIVAYFRPKRRDMGSDV